MSDARRLPANLDAENSLIGAILLAPELMRVAMTTVQPGDFFQPKAQHLFAAMCELHSKGQPVDIVTISDALVDVDREWMLACQNVTPSLSYAPHYANLVIEESRRRQFIALGAQVQQMAYDHADPDVIMDAADPRMNPLVRPRNAAIKDLLDVRDWERDSQEADDAEPWLIPHICKRRWRMILVASEGVGKATFLRQLGLHAAAGLDPFDASCKIKPIRVLYVDCENSASSIRHQHKLANKTLDLVAMSQGRYFLMHREAGFDIRQRVTLSEIEAAIQQTKPDLVIMGPLYKMFKRNRSEDWETPAGQVAEILDDLRVRYNFAIMIEAHAAKGDGKTPRVLTPFGSSVWARWAETGVAMNDHGEAKDNPPQMTVDVEFFRPPRDIAEWPIRLTRGGLSQNLAWSPTFDYARGVGIGAKFIDGEWTYTTPVKPGAQRSADQGS